MATQITRPTGPVELPGHESTQALTLVPSRSMSVLIPEPVGLPPQIADAYLKAMTAVQDLLESPEVQSRFAQVMLTHLRQKPALLHCDPTSLVVSILEMAAHNLDPSVANECHLVPYEGKVTMQVGYGGLIKLALAHPDVLDIWADEVCDNDTYEFYGVNAQPRHVYPAKFAPRGRYIGYYAVALLSGHRCRAVQQSVEEIKDHARRFSINATKKVWSEGNGGGFRGMAFKTALRMLCNTKHIPVAGKVADLFRRMDTIEGVIDAERAEEAADARHSLEAGKSLADHIEDLTGSRPQAATPRPASPAGAHAADYVVQLEALVLAQGGDIPAFWAWAEKQKKAPQAQFSEADYADLLRRAQSQAKKRQTEDAQACTGASQQESTSEKTPDIPDPRTDDPGASDVISGDEVSDDYTNVDPETGEVFDLHVSAALDRTLDADGNEPF